MDGPEIVTEYEAIRYEKNGRRRAAHKWGICDESFVPPVWLATLKFGARCMWTADPPERLGFAAEAEAREVLAELWSWRQLREQATGGS